ncbi:hypothetical protein VOLCADRAFT_88004 [Volvox carteri f. nagariensis]|uniref:Uncharacterized protein n=1 Tax=Volvox carteri f. nagariensis TaxID=3068 RepID=D8TMT8_VOLCA|nr:uncharacterized protein VOLCADRAFT_88004 [Volvox carteri f. nagariensis]EFJ51310.1 hypothetical protein VOLCADRAFT_88004 [Volvox carteri f. nagariensis]|eukprot:XP_002947777.1 hypothetical protein VOLCADRAFT_88004 [Volvox carteri f. nagariensis]
MDTSFVSMCPSQVQMVFKGSVSYRKDIVNYVRINANVEAKISRLDRACAQIAFVDNDDQPVPAPSNLTVVFQGTQHPAARVGQVFLISWMENYVILVNGVELFRLENQLAIDSGADLVTRIVQA